jgi:flagellar biosynthesis GTPase FlhF
MGKTGSGKSTFISKLATRNYEHAVGHELRSSKFQVALATL